MKAILTKNDTQEQIEVHSTTRHPRSRHGVPVWVDSDGIAYCRDSFCYGKTFARR